MSMRFCRLSAALVFSCLSPLPGFAREVIVPIQLRHTLLTNAVRTQLYRDADHTARVWDDGTGCNFLILSDPSVDTRAGKLRVLSSARARVGTSVGDSCLTLLDWKGKIETLEESTVSKDEPVVTFRVVDSNILDEKGNKPQVTSNLWNWVKEFVHPRMEELRVDLAQPLLDLHEVLPYFLPDDESERVSALIKSLTLAGVTANDTGLSVALRFDVPAREETTPVPEPTLTAEEIRRFETSLQQWDAFLTFVTRSAAGSTTASAARTTLLAVLIEGRHEIFDALAPETPPTSDPVRKLFLRSWDRLAPILGQLGADLPGEEAARYLSFVAAADALKAIDDLGPELGIEISADGLRRLARILGSAQIGDPIDYDMKLDPDLRKVFEFGEPIEPPLENPDADLSFWSWLVPAAHASIEPDRATIERLNRWAPTLDDVETYLPLVLGVLESSALGIRTKRKLDTRYHEIYRDLILAAAWQETCWRQFIRESGKLKPIRSPVGSVGLMQVNLKVWRGFYDQDGLLKDISYNARAGSEIMAHYLIDYAIKKGEHTATGDPDNLARSSYSIYNGGPGHLKRYRKSKTSKSLRLIDDAFWQKYLIVKSGNDLGVLRCYKK